MKKKNSKEKRFFDMWILISLLVTVVVALGFCLQFYKNEASELIELTTVANQMKAEFEEQLLALAASIYRRPTKIEPSIERVASSWFFKHHYRVLLAITLSSSEDFHTTYTMIQKFMVSYLARPENNRYKVRIFFKPVSTP